MTLFSRLLEVAEFSDPKVAPHSSPTLDRRKLQMADQTRFGRHLVVRKDRQVHFQKQVKSNSLGVNTWQWATDATQQTYATFSESKFTVYCPIFITEVSWTFFSVLYFWAYRTIEIIRYLRCFWKSGRLKKSESKPEISPILAEIRPFSYKFTATETVLPSGIESTFSRNFRKRFEVIFGRLTLRLPWYHKWYYFDF